MSQNEERARAIAQARKFMEMTRARGASEAEAQVAMEKLSRIKQTFDLTLDEIIINSLEYQQKGVPWNTVKGCPMFTVVMAIAEFTDTKVWCEHGKKEYKYRSGRMVTVEPGNYQYFGIESDVDMAIYIHELISESLKRCEKDFKKSEVYTNITRRGGKRSALISFRKGFIRRINIRLGEMSIENEREVEATTGTDLVFVKSKVREEKFKEQIGVKLVKVQTGRRGITNTRAGSEGANSANTVSLNRPVGGGGSSVKLLT